MKLRSAVTLFAVLICGVFAALCWALIATTNLLDLQAQQLARAGDSIRVAQSVKSRLLAHNRNNFLYLLHADPARLESLDGLRDEIGALLLEAELLINNDEERRVVDDVLRVTEAYMATLGRLEDGAASMEERFSRASIEADNAIAVVDRLTAVNRLQMEELSAAIGARNGNVNLIAVSLFVIGATILSGVAVAVFRFITRPLIQLAQCMTLFTKSGVAVPSEPAGVTEIRTLSASFNSLAKRLEEKRKDQLRFIASIAHDLRNPLNSMSITTGLLLRGHTAESQRMLEVLARQVKVLERLVGDLLDTAHIESGHLELDPALLDVGALVADAVDLHRGTSALHAFNLELAGDLHCRGDGARLTQVINNLLTNAIKYSPHGGVITVRAWRDDALCVLSVEDQGIGIEAEDIENIFMPFHRSNATKGAIPGIGLGLSTSRRIVEAHGGNLEASSRTGRGATFYVRLPCARDALPKANEPGGGALHPAKGAGTGPPEAD